MADTPVMAYGDWPTNGHLIADCVRLKYLQADWRILDPTYGHGTFWKVWRPRNLVACDLDLDKSPVGHPVNFTALPWPDRTFDAVVFDPPYKLNGRPDPAVDSRYGTDTPVRWQDRMALIRQGISECARVLANGYLLVKSMSQVSSGKVRWQPYECYETAQTCGLELIDEFHMVSYRPQPFDRRQVHARRNCSTLQVYRRFK